MTSASMLDALKAQPVLIKEKTDVSYTSDEGKRLIATYGITRVPTLILQGETDKDNVRAFLDTHADRRDDAMIWSILQPVYLDPATGNAMGRVDVTLIRDASCADCTDPDVFLKQLTGMGMKQKSLTELDRSAPEARRLAERYGLTSIPALILSADAQQYPAIVSAWRGFGTTTSDGLLVADPKYAPYAEFASGHVRGRVHATFITDKTCTSCYDVAAFRNILKGNFGVALTDEQTVDVASDAGAALVKRYGLAQAPTLLLTGDVQAYPDLQRAWLPVGTVADDGTYVFRKVSTMGTYRDLLIGSIVDPSAATTSSTP